MTTSEAVTASRMTRAPAGLSLLDGVVVVEVAHRLTEYAGVALAGLGAEVWLVEPPQGAATRSRHPYVEAASPSRRSIAFLSRNIGKRSVVLDAADPADRRRFAELLTRADVVIEHEDSPFAELTTASPAAAVRITCTDGLGSSSLVAFAASGSISSSGWPHQPPCNAPSWLALDAAGTYAAALAVLLVRERRTFGRRRLAEVPLAEAGIAGLTNWIRSLNSYGMVSAGQGIQTARTGSGAFYVLPCRNGYVRVIAATMRQWQAFLELLGEPEVLLDPVWDSFQFRNDNFDAVFLTAAEILADQDVDDVFHRGQQLGLPVTPALTIDGVMHDPHVRARELFTEVDDPELGAVQMLRPPLRLGPADVRALTVAPRLDEHRDELARMLAKRPPTPAPRATGEPTPRPLTGLRVLSFGVGAVVPEASSLLAQLGAEVIKIESRNGLDFFRQLGGDFTGDINNTPTFNQVNLGVTSCTIDAGSDDGRAVLRALVARSDIVMENMRGPVMRKFGMDVDSVRAIKPDIIYMSSQGLGAGPYETFVTYGPNLQSFAGMTSIWAHPDDPYPVGSVLSYPDDMAGKQGLIGIFAALLRRDATGAGAHLDSAQFEVCVWSIADKFLQQQLLPGTIEALGNRSLDHAPQGCYPCAGDDQWCALSVEDDAAWARLVALIGDAALADPALSGADGRLAATPTIDAAVSAWTRTLDPPEAVRQLRTVGVAASIMVDGPSQAANQAMHDSGFYAAIAHPTVGLHWHTALPFLLDGERPVPRRPPLLGEHTEHVLYDVIGLPADEVGRLLRSGAAGV